MTKPGLFARATWARGIFPYQFAWLLDNPVRRLLLTPEALARRLPISESSRILEVGPGSGFFSVELAKRVPDGWLELMDVQPQMLAKAKRKLVAHDIRNVGYTGGDAGGTLPFADTRFDVVVLVSVLGEIRQQNQCLQSILRVLRPGGTLGCHEAIPDPDRIPYRRLRSLIEAQGFVFAERWGPAWNYTATFLKPV